MRSAIKRFGLSLLLTGGCLAMGCERHGDRENDPTKHGRAPAPTGHGDTTDMKGGTANRAGPGGNFDTMSPRPATRPDITTGTGEGTGAAGVAQSGVGGSTGNTGAGGVGGTSSNAR